MTLMRNTRLMVKSILALPALGCPCHHPVLCCMSPAGLPSPAVSLQAGTTLVASLGRALSPAGCLHVMVEHRNYFHAVFQPGSRLASATKHNSLVFLFLFPKNIPNVFQSRAQRMLFSSPWWAEELACFLPTQRAMISHRSVISCQATSIWEGSAGVAWANTSGYCCIDFHQQQVQKCKIKGES